MSLFFSEENMRNIFSAPQYTRMRHRFKGIRESEKINLEIGQTYFSIKSLYESYNNFQTKFINRANTLLEGGPSGVELNEDGPIDLPGIENLAFRLNALKKRIESLEE